MVVGGGVIGCAVAFALAREGLSVVLVERDRVGAHASSAAAGMLAPIAESLGEGPLGEAGVRSLELFPAVVDEARALSGIDPQLTRTGLLRVASPADVARLRLRAEALARFDCEWLDAEQARKREPGLGPAVAGALWSPREAHVEPELLTRAFAAAAARRGCRLELGAEAAGLVRDRKRVIGVRLVDRELSAGYVVVCTGAWLRSWEAELGLRLPVEPVRGQMLSLEAAGSAPTSIVWGDGAYVVPRRDGTVAVGATVERAGFDVRTTADGIASLLHGATELMPELGKCAFRRAWAGLRPGTPDHLPLVGPLPGAPGLAVAAGHYRNGILLSPWTAVAVAEGLLGGRWPREAAPFDPARFER